MAEAEKAAQNWFDAYKKGDPVWLAGWSATPFTAGGEIVAKDAAKLRALYKSLVAEGTSGAVSGLEVLTAAGARRRLGGLPPGGEETEMLFAVGRVGKDELILLLKKSNLGWRVCGLDR